MLIESLALPLAALAIISGTSFSKSIFSEFKTFLICSARFSLVMGSSLKCRHLDITVSGSFSGSVVASKNFTCSGGSSIVLSKALKLLVDNM